MTDAICPYCRCPIDEAAGEQILCTGCNTPHHQDCYAENGGCTVFGCSQAPPDEAKMSVSTQEITAPALSAPPPAVPAPTYMLFPVGEAATATAAAPFAGAGTLPPSPAFGSTSVPPPPPPPGAPAMMPPPPAQWQQTPARQLTAAELYNNAAKPKDRVTFILLGVFLGMFGAHNFYAGYHKKAAFQLCITLLTCFYGTPVSWIWAIVEICVIKADADGNQFA